MSRISEYRSPQAGYVVHVPVSYPGAFGVAYQYADEDRRNDPKSSFSKNEAESAAAAFAEVILQRRRGIDTLYGELQADGSRVPLVPINFIQQAEKQLQAVFETSYKSQRIAGFPKRA